VTTPLEVRREPKIAVAIPCFNEAAAIGKVVAEFQASLPAAEIVVLDNNSTDGTGDLARNLGARVERVLRQGKGHAVRAAFELLRDRDVLVLVDGDGTYPAEAAPSLVAPVLEGEADMVVGARQPETGARAMSPIRGAGNLLIRLAFRLLMGARSGDLLSGYRAFSQRFLQSVALQSEGFEIETELAIAAASRGLRTMEVSIPYRPRIAGTVSKLRAFRDGQRILRTIVLSAVQHHPLRIAGIWVLIITLLSLPFLGYEMVRWSWGIALAVGMVAIAWVRARSRRDESHPGGSEPRGLSPGTWNPGPSDERGFASDETVAGPNGRTAASAEPQSGA